MVIESFISEKNPALATAHNIMALLGGARFRRMSQAHGFSGCAGGTEAEPVAWLQMQLSPAVQAGVGGRVGRQRLRISQYASGYTMEFYNPGPAGEKQQLLRLDHVLAAELRAMFTYATGFFLTEEAALGAGEWLAWLRRATAEYGGSTAAGLDPRLRALTFILLGGLPSPAGHF